MKKLSITFLLLPFLKISFSQGYSIFKADYVISYSLIHSPDTNNLADQDKAVYYLFGNSEGSYWVEKGKYLSDSSVSKLSDKPSDLTQAMQIIHSLPKPKSFATIHKNYTQHTIQYIDQIRSESFYYMEPSNTIVWNLENKNQVISGFNCQSASCQFKGRQYEAWFTTDIGIQEGPYKFIGLPGTIVKIRDFKNQVQFELLSIRKGSFEIAVPDRSKNAGIKQVSSVELKRMKEDALKNPLVGMESRGQVMDEENRRKVMERARIRSARFNNPIELID